MKNLNIGSKFQLIKPLVIERGIQKTTYPSGLVISLFHYSVLTSGKRMKFKIIRAAPVVQRYYEDIPEEVYIPQGIYYAPFWNTLSLFNDECRLFFEGLLDGSIVTFTYEYEALTRT